MGDIETLTICFFLPAPKTVTGLRIQDQTRSSITLSWTAPVGPGHPLYTYWVSWIKESSIVTRTHNTTDTRITLKELEAGSLYTFAVWVERNGISSDNETLSGATGEIQSSSGPSTIGMGKDNDRVCWEFPGRLTVLGDLLQPHQTLSL